MRTNKRFSKALAWLVATALTVGVIGCGRPDSPPTQARPPREVVANLQTIVERPTSGTYTATGTVKPLLSATLSSKIMGRVVTVAVREGDAIRAGQPLVQIDPRELRSAVNVAEANYAASIVAVGSAKTAASMEEKVSKARIIQAETQVEQAKAALAAAEARRDLALAGPRAQEIAQSRIAVAQAESSLKLAELALERSKALVEAGAVARKQLEQDQNRFDVAKGQYEAALQADSIAREGSRTQEIRAAEEAVMQAKAALKQAQSAVVQAKAAAMQVEMRKRDIEAASAQVRQSAAATESAKVGLSYASVLAPFDGRVVGRVVDPGAMASTGVPLLLVEGGEYRLEAVVPERILGKISKGGAGQVQIDSLGGKPMPARVAEIVPQGDPSSHSFIVKFSLGSPAGLKSGMFGRVSIRTGAVSRILIPASATWVKEGLNYVFVVNKEGIARLRIITLGEISGDELEVLSGLGNGDQIVVGDRSDVEDGVRVGAK